jgi:uncharacterized damage-inducible protein DinB
MAMTTSTVIELEAAPGDGDLRDSAADRTECAALLSCLSKQREHVLGALDGLSEQALRQAVLPSGWTCAGLVQHLALDVERFWFRQVMTGEQVGPDEFGDDGWQLRPEVSAAAVLDLYRREIALADKIITRTSLEAPPAWWPDFFSPGFHLDALRQVLLHVIAETACHAGHVDAARELIDGSQWLVLT